MIAGIASFRSGWKATALPSAPSSASSAPTDVEKSPATDFSMILPPVAADEDKEKEEKPHFPDDEKTPSLISA